MEKISPEVISEFTYYEFEERDYKFSRKVWWYKYSLSFNLLPIITRLFVEVLAEPAPLPIITLYAPVVFLPD